ncbi:MAG: AmmeMemoRadiSam system protein B [Candidatus Ranarchaeia archaeon]
MKTRYPAAIGFYPGEKGELKKQIEKCFLDATSQTVRYEPDHVHPREIIAGVSPHAGYVFSGSTCAKLMAALAGDGKPEVFVLVGLLHNGLPLQAIMSEGNWQTPLCASPIDKELATAIHEASAIIVENEEAHKHEHSIEVQLPFLQYLFGDIPIVPIAIGPSDFEDLEDVGNAIASGVQSTNKDVVVIASTDMTHYGYAYGYTPVGTGPVSKVLEFMRQSDGENIGFIESLDAKGLFENVKSKGITMCGVAPVAAALIAANKLGAKKVESLQYTTSYDTFGGSSDQIVGYYSALIKR